MFSGVSTHVLGMATATRVWRLTRAGGGLPDPADFARRAQVFTRTAKSSTLVTLHDGGGLRSFVVVPEGHDADQAALHLAQAVAARAEPVEMPALGGAAVGWLVARPSSTAVRDPQAGADPAEVARRLAVAMRPGSWLAVLVRESGRSEVRWSRRWYEARLGTTMPVHHSTGKSVTVSFLAGGDSAFEVRSMLDQVAGSLPGFDVEVVSRVGSMRRTVAPWLVASAVAWAGVVVGVGWSALAGAAAALAPALVGLFVSAGRAGSMVGRVRRFAEQGVFVRPARRILPAKRPSPGSGSGWLDRLGGGDYPLASTSFLVGPQVVVGVVAPHAGASSGAALTERRAAPSGLLDRIGPALGVAGEAAAMVHLPAESAWGGVGLAGTPGSGKALDLSSRIPVPVSGRFPSGWALNSELEVGDELFAGDGSVTTVIGFSDVFVGNAFDVEFSDGQVVRCDADHLWKASSRKKRQRVQRATTAGIRASNSAEVERLRALARGVAPGTFASAKDLAEMIHCSPSHVRASARAFGIEGAETLMVVEPARFSRQKRHRREWAADDVAAVIESLSASKWSPIQPDDSRRFSDREWWCASDAFVRTFNRPPVGNDVEVMRARLSSSGAPSRTVAVLADIDFRATVKSVITYPMAEVLWSFADRLEQAEVPLRESETIVSTKDLADAVMEGGHRNWAVRVGETIELPASDLRVDPYVLGAWLGDGDTDIGALTCGAQDVDEVAARLGDIWGPVVVRETSSGAFRLTLPRPRRDLCGYGHPVTQEAGRPSRTAPCSECVRVRGRRRSAGLTGRAVDGVERWNVPLTTALGELGLLGAKHIPATYLRASAAQRLAVLQGLMDTDGHIDPNGSCELTLCNERLATHALELIRSLGIKGSMRSSDASITEPDPDRPGYKRRRIVGTRWRIVFTTSQPVFRLRRKLERVPTKTRATQHHVYVVDVRSAPPTPVRCISIAHPDSTFLVEGFVRTHNSSAVRSIWGWNCVERVAPSGTPGFPGERNALVAFESKPDGAAWYRRWSEGVGDEVSIIEVGDPSTWSIDLLGVPGTAEERARFFVNAMVYAFNDGAIQDRSFETLTAVLTAALCVTPSIAAAAGVSPDGSPLFFAHVLLGGLGDPMAVALAESLASEATRSEREAGSRSLPAAGGTQGAFVPLTEIGMADQKLMPMFGGRSTEATRRSLCEAPRNKLGQLLGAESWWSPARVKVTWDQVLEHHLAVVVNTGVSTSGAVVDERLSGQMSALLMYGLRDAIQRRCSGWQEEGRSVSIFADELALLVGSSADVVTWLRNQGRSYGVRATFATQYPEQLPRPVRTVFMSFDTFVWFAQTNAEVVAEAAADLSLDGSDWTAADLAGLEPFTAVVRTRLGGQRLPAVPVKVAFWEGDIASYRADVVS